MFSYPRFGVRTAFNSSFDGLYTIESISTTLLITFDLFTGIWRGFYQQFPISSLLTLHSSLSGTISYWNFDWILSRAILRFLLRIVLSNNMESLSTHMFYHPNPSESHLKVFYSKSLQSILWYYFSPIPSVIFLSTFWSTDYVQIFIWWSLHDVVYLYDSLYQFRPFYGDLARILSAISNFQFADTSFVSFEDYFLLEFRLDSQSCDFPFSAQSRSFQ